MGTLCIHYETPKQPSHGSKTRDLYLHLLIMYSFNTMTGVPGLYQLYYINNKNEMLCLGLVIQLIKNRVHNHFYCIIALQLFSSLNCLFSKDLMMVDFTVVTSKSLDSLDIEQTRH